ncbi:MAG: efflux RND transporter periplasmic adaptor subunit [Pleurocapsa minor HA4230-MV1]|jgi:cobalt-zinc-cadmium efflux system membrane fusion protein|nr:efflux RND transporter periplasmic adaptor subunit [Pleurocapsa minor HA4230-MV1]
MTITRYLFRLPNSLTRSTGVILSLILITAPTSVLAHAGHGNEFQGGDSQQEASDSIQVDDQTAKSLGIKVEPVTSQRLDISIKTTGQIEALPSQQVEVTSPIPGKVNELLVEPGAYVKAGQPVAVIASPDLIELRVSSQEKQAQAKAELQQTQADLDLAQQNYQRQVEIAKAELQQAQTQVAVAQEQYDRDRELANKGVIPRRQMLESQAKLAETKAQLTTASSQREVLAAQNQLKRSQSSLEAANSLLQLSNTTYQARLQQLGTEANDRGLAIITAPISGRVSDREVTLGQAFQDAGGQLMTIIDDTTVFATANIYEQDLDKVKQGQQVRAKVASLSDRAFIGKIAVIGSIVEGETRVVPVKAQLSNNNGTLKPGMFAELEVMTTKADTTATVIPSSAIVDAEGKKLVYLQNGDSFQSVEVNLGQTSGDLVEVKSGLFEGDLVVTQRAPQLYAQSLRGGSKEETATKPEGGADEAKKSQESQSSSTTLEEQLPLWLLGATGGGVIGVSAFLAGGYFTSRRHRSRKEDKATSYETEIYLNNHHQTSTLSSSIDSAEEHEEFQKPN